MDKAKAQRFTQFLIKKYGEDGAKKKIQKILKTGKVDEEDIKDFAASEQKQQLQQAQKAAHGAKLNYFKSLKNQCAEDEEVVYFKKGGSVTCGCKKKEQGGEVPTAKQGSAIEKFKKARKAATGTEFQKPPFKQETPTKKKPTQGETRTIWVSKAQAEKNKQEKKNPTKKPQDSAVEKEDIPSYDKKTPKKACGSKIKKHQEGSVIAKFKMHRLGGSLNRIPFYLKGTVKLGILPWRTLEEVEAINNREKEMAKLYFTSTPSISNIWEGLKHAYNGWIEPLTTYQTGTAPLPTKAKTAWEALQMVKAMKALKAAKTAEIAKARMIAGLKSAATRRANGTARGGTPGLKKLEQVPDIPNYLEIYDGYKMTKASRLNMNNVLDKLPDSEREMVLKVITSNPDHYLNTIGNITPGKAGSMISTIRRKLPGVEYTPLRVKSLDLTRPNMGTGIFLKFDDATSKTAGFKRITDKY